MKPLTVDCPFVGLVPYTEDDAEFFFGRERDQQLILANLYASRLTILYGASGVGKSSVLRAGIVQEVRKRIDRAKASGEEPEIAVVYFKEWKGDILASLRSAIGAALLAQLGTDYTADLRADLDLEKLLVKIGERFRGDLVLIIDQFEEYFLYHPDPTPDSFAKQLAAAANHRDRPEPWGRRTVWDTMEPASVPAVFPARYLISLRDDAVSRLDRFKPLIPGLFSNYLRLRHLSGEDAWAAILGPVARYNELLDSRKAHPGAFSVETGDGQGAIKPDLPGLVIEQVRTGRVLVGQVGQGTLAAATAAIAVETPYLQLVMTRLWREELQQSSHTLRCSTLNALGGAEAIVKGHLEGALGGLSERERDICALLFPHLVTPSGTKIAHSVVNLARFAKAQEAELKPLLERLASSDKRILAPVAPPDGEPHQVQYEIYHDSLAQAVLSWQARYEANRERTARARERKRILAIAVALAIAFLIAAGGAWAAYRQYRIAESEKAAALAARAEIKRLLSEKELVEARATNNVTLIRQREQELARASAEAKKFQDAATAQKPAGAGPTMAEMIVERDRLRAELDSVLAGSTAPAKKEQPIVRGEKDDKTSVPSAPNTAVAPVVAKSTAEIDAAIVALARTDEDLALVLLRYLGQKTGTLSEPAENLLWKAASPMWSFDRQLAASRMVFSPDNKTIALSSGTTLILQNVETGGAPDIVGATSWAMEFAPDGSFIALGGYQLDLYYLASKKFVRGPKDSTGVGALAVNKNTVSFYWKNTAEVRAIDYLGRATSQRFRNPTRALITGLAYQPGSDLLYILDAGGNIGFFPGSVQNHWGAVYFPPDSLMFSANGRRLAVLSRESGQISLFDVENRRNTLYTPMSAAAFAFNRDGSRIATTKDTSIVLWAPSAKNAIYNAPGSVIALASWPGSLAAFTPDGNYLAIWDRPHLLIYPGNVQGILAQVKITHPRTPTTAECRQHLGLDPCPIF